MAGELSKPNYHVKLQVAYLNPLHFVSEALGRYKVSTQLLEAAWCS